MKKYFLNYLMLATSILKSLRSKGHILEKESRFFTHEHKKTWNLGKLYLLPKIHKRPWCSSRKASHLELWDPYQKSIWISRLHFKQVMQNGFSYIINSGYFLEKIEVVGENFWKCIVSESRCSGFVPTYPSQGWFECSQGSSYLNIMP